MPTMKAQFPAFVAGIWDEETAGRTNFKLLPLLEAYDTFTGNRKYAYVLLAIALATILIACCATEGAADTDGGNTTDGESAADASPLQQTTNNGQRTMSC